MNFKVNDRVKWTNPGRKGPGETYSGVVIAVVEKQQRPDPALYPAFVKGRQTGVRDEESYVVKGDDGKNYWPLVHRLIGETQQATTQAAPVTGTSATGTTSTIQNADGSTSVSTEKTTKVTNQDGSETTTTTTTTQVTKADGTVTTTTTTSETTTVAKSLLETDFVILLDRSGSMSSIRTETVKAFNDQVQAIKDSAQKAGLKAPRVTLWTFGGSPRQEYFRQPVDTLKPLALDSYYPTGGTPLIKCMKKAIEAMTSESDIANNKNCSVVLSVITDGEDTDGDFPGSPTGKMIRDCIATDRWTVAMMLPRGYKQIFLARHQQNLNLSDGNVIEWETTSKGMRDSVAVTASAVSNFMATRSTGVSSVKSYYVQPNLKAVSAADLAKLPDLSGTYKVHTVDQEARIDDFIAGKTGSPYIIGSAYYQLTKHEKCVQPYKGVLLRDKFSKKIYGGIEARRLIGLPDGVNAEVDPGNHGDFDIFVESTSVNRRLPRGSLLLHDFRMVVAKAPTWVAKPTTTNP